MRSLPTSHDRRSGGRPACRRCEVVRSIETGGNPQAMAITNDGDRERLDERVYVTRMFGELIDAGAAGRLRRCQAGRRSTRSRSAPPSTGTAQRGADQHLAPFASGFNADRRQFCQATRDQIEGTVIAPRTPADLLQQRRGPDTDQRQLTDLANADVLPERELATTPRAGGEIGKVAQKVYPNMLYSALIRGRQAVRAERGASPEPPVRFNVNVQGAGRRDRSHPGRRAARRTRTLSLNLNSQVAKETQPARPTRRTRSISCSSTTSWRSTRIAADATSCSSAAAATT